MVGAGGILRIIVNFSRLSRESYSTLAQPPLSTHSWYNFRRREVTGRGGGGSLPAAGGVAVR
jgi:hypothetical protein